MTDLIAYQPSHLLQLTLQGAQRYLTETITPKVAADLAPYPSYTVVRDGRILGCGGIIPQWQGRGMCWAFVDENASGVNFMGIHRHVKRFLDGCYTRRIEATVDCEFPQGHRWVEMLGFELETPRMRVYTPCGKDAAMYVRIRE